jgi:glucosamine--fructose-6-phosphate aminotransferase (isomerizing)
MGLYDEINEQPEVLSALMDRRELFLDIAAALRTRDIHYVFLTARGTSDNAGLYAKYLLGSFNELPVALAAPSLFTMYQSPPRLDGALVMGISQSGTSTDVVQVVRWAREQGSTTLAITNDVYSPIAEAAEFVIDLQAGVEKAIAATKTYTAQLLAIAMLSASLKGDQERFESLAQIPRIVSQLLELDASIEAMADRYRSIERCIVLGRGFNYCTAYEWALKLEEMTYVVAEPYSSADFQHGPIAIIEKGFPVFCVLPDGVVFDVMYRLGSALMHERKAELIVISNREEALRMANSAIPLPIPLAEWMSPIACIVPAQLFVYHLTRAKGYDTEHPRGLKKMTDTR